MNLTIVQPDLAGGTVELQKIIWQRGARNANKSVATLVFFGCLFLALSFVSPKHDGGNMIGHSVPLSSWGLLESMACVFLSLAALFGYARVVQKRKYNARIKGITDRLRTGTNTCAFTLTDSELKYSSDEYNCELKWSLLRKMSVEGWWIILEFDFSVFGIDTRLITEPQKQEAIAFLHGITSSKTSVV